MPTSRRVTLSKSEPREPELTDPRDLPVSDEHLSDLTHLPPTKSRRRTMNILERLKHKSTVYGILAGLATAIAAVTGFTIGEPVLDVAAFVISGIVSVILIFWKPKSE